MNNINIESQFLRILKYKGAKSTIILSLFIFLIKNNLSAQYVNYTSFPFEVGGVDQSATPGSIAGQSVVLNGASGYSIPLTAAPGTGGVVPALSINYSSSGGTSTLGYGWGLSGLSAITRTGQNIYFDGKNTAIRLDGSDKLALNGERLIALSGTYLEAGSIYGTESENFTRVTAVGGTTASPDHFVMETKDGMIYEFGKDFNSKHTSPAFMGFIWNVSKMIYPDGNYVEYHYKLDHTMNNQSWYEPVIEEIHYTGNTFAGLSPHAMIKFEYRMRNDRIKNYNQNLNFENNLLIHKIEMTTENQFVRRYDFEYAFRKENSYLVGVTEIGVNAYLGKTSFVYGEQNSNLEIIEENISNTQTYFSANLNGDGLNDRVLAQRESPTNSYHSSFNALAREDIPGPSSVPPILINVTLNLPAFSQVVGVGDCNGDGIDEIAVIKKTPVDLNNSSISLILYHNHNVNSSLSFSNTHTIVAPFNLGNSFTSNVGLIHQGDFNADGLLDYFMTTEGGIFIAYGQRNQLQPLDQWQFVSIGSSSFLGSGQWYTSLERLYVSDFNADGKSDLLLIDGWSAAIFSFNDDGTQLSNIYYYNGENTTLNLRTFDQENLLWFGDFNGDGHTDILKKSSNSGSFTFMYTGLNTLGEITFASDAFLPNIVPNITQQGFGNYVGDIISIGDFNGDKKADIAHIGDSGGARLSMYYSGNILSFMAPTSLNLPYISSVNVSPYIGKDGQARTLYRTYTNQTPVQVGVSPNSQELLLREVGNNDGHVTRFEYRLMNEKLSEFDNFYFRGDLAAAEASITNIELPVWIVSSFKVSNGQGGEKIQNYYYEKSTLHRNGKGIIGFQKILTKDLGTYIDLEATFVPDPGLGIMIPSIQTSSRQSYQPFFTSSTNFNITNVPQGRFLMTPFSTEIINYDENRRTTTTYNGYDSYANPLGSTTTITQGFFNSVVETTTTSFGNYQAWGSSIPSKPRTSYSSAIRTGETPFDKNTTFQYNTKGQVIEKVDYSNLFQKITTTYGYHAHGGLAGATMSAQGAPTKSTSQNYDPLGRIVINRQDELGNTTYSVSSFDPRYGVPLEMVDIRGLTTTNTYDGWGRLITSTSPEGLLTTKAYNWAGNGKQETTTTSGRAPIISYTDMLNRSTGTSTIGINNLSIGNFVSYDQLGRVQSSTDEGGIFSNNEYDANTTAQRLKKKTTNFGETNYSYLYNDGIERLTSTLPDYKTVITYTDASGKQTRITDSNNKDLHYTYSSSGGIATVTQNNVQLLNVGYDYAGRKSYQTDISSGTTSYAYDAYGRMTSETNPKGQTTMTYDILDRLVTVTRPEGTTSYAYYPFGGVKSYKLMSISGFGGELTVYDYDHLGRLDEEKITVNGQTYTTTYTYDGFSRLATTTYPSGLTLTNEYDNNGNLYRVKNGNQAYYTINAEDGRGRAINLTTGDGKTRLLEYSSDLPTRIRTTDNTFDLQMNWNLSTQNLNNRIDNKGNRDDFTYDNLDRLKTCTRTRGTDIRIDTVNYTDQGNITYKSDIGGYEYDATSIFAMRSVDNKNGLIPAAEQHISYNSFHQPIFIEQGQHRIEFTYGYGGQRLSSTKYHNGQQTEYRIYLDGYEILSSGGQTRYLHYLGLDMGLVTIIESQNGTHTPQYIYTDHLGSIVRATNASGTIEWEQNFDAWGRYRDPNTWAYVSTPTLPVWLNRGYTGHEMLNEVGLIHMNARLYDLLIARMLSPDNVISAPGYSQNYNRYSYAYNNPLKYIDPDGNEPITALLVGAAVGVVTNGLGNMQSGRSFFQGAGKAAAFGAISGLVSFGIGEAANGLFPTSKLAQSAFQFGAHGLTGGAMAELQGGKFLHGFASGAISSAVSSGASALRMGPELMIMSGGLSGGLGSWITGGSFTDGVRQGIISSALNHAMHESTDDPIERLKQLFHEWNSQRQGQKVVSSVKLNGWVVDKLANGETKSYREVMAGTPPDLGLAKVVGLAKKAYVVYEGLDAAGKVRYVGITGRDAGIRFGEHLSSIGTGKELLRYRVINGATNLSKTQARVLEQTLINQFGMQKNGGMLLNQINSISSKNWIYYGIK